MNTIMYTGQPECIFPAEEMGDHNRNRQYHANRSRKTCAKYPHVQPKHKIQISENIKASAAQSRKGRKPWRIIVSQVSGEHLRERICRNHKLNRAKICLCQWQKNIIRTKQTEQLVIKNSESNPTDLYFKAEYKNNRP